MAIQTLHDTETDILAKYDGAVYQIATKDCVIAGIGDQFTINYQSDSLNVTFNAGSEAIIGGAFFKVTSLTAVTLTANSTIYLCANINLANPNLQTGSFVERTSSNMKSENLNGSGSQRDLLLYVIQTGTNGVISVQDRRNIKSTGVELYSSTGNNTDGAMTQQAVTNLPTILHGTTAPTSALGKNGDIYVLHN